MKTVERLLAEKLLKSVLSNYNPKILSFGHRAGTRPYIPTIAEHSLTPKSGRLLK